MNDKQTDRFGMWAFTVVALVVGPLALISGRSGWRAAHGSGVHVQIAGGALILVGIGTLALLLRESRKR